MNGEWNNGLWEKTWVLKLCSESHDRITHQVHHRETQRQIPQHKYCSQSASCSPANIINHTIVTDPKHTVSAKLLHGHGPHLASLHRNGALSNQLPVNMAINRPWTIYNQHFLLTNWFSTGLRSNLPGLVNVMLTTPTSVLLYKLTQSWQQQLAIVAFKAPYKFAFTLHYILRNFYIQLIQHYILQHYHHPKTSVQACTSSQHISPGMHLQSTHQSRHAPPVNTSVQACTSSYMHYSAVYKFTHFLTYLLTYLPTYLLIHNIVSRVLSCGACSPVAMTTQLSRPSIRTELMIFHCSLYTQRLTITHHVRHGDTPQQMPQQ